MLRIRNVWAWLALFVIGADLPGQQVRGHTRDVATGNPIPAVVVSLVDAAGKTIARTISDGNGAYHVGGDGSAVGLRATRIGFQPFRGPVTPSAADGTLTVDVAMSALPTLLQAVDVHDQSQCAARSDAPTAFGLWEQARSALLATVVAREANPANVGVLLYTRDSDLTGFHPPTQTVAESVFTASRAFISARATEDYDRLGYRDIVDSAHQMFYAPDAEVLLDPEFIRGHCLSLRGDAPDHPGEVGLVFAPAPGADSVVNISGTIWIRRATPALRSIDFRFTHLDPLMMDNGAGGQLIFAEMPNGIVMEERWNLHLPMVEQHRNALLIKTGHLIGIHDTGGEMAEVLWPDGARWQGTLGAIRGSVTEEVTGAPLADIPVALRGSNLRTHSDSSGRFVFLPLLPGPYTVDAADTIFAQFGVASRVSTAVDVDRSAVAAVHFIMPSRTRDITHLCDNIRHRSQGIPPGNDVIMGRALRLNGQAVADATVRVRWTAGWVPGQVMTFAARTDATGVFEFCGVPRDAAMTLGAARDSLVSSDTAVALGPKDVVTRVTLRLQSPEAAALPAFRRRTIVVADAFSGQPLGDVEILDAFVDGVIGRTSAAGIASLAPLPAGASLLRVQKAGYDARTVVVRVAPDDSLPVSVSMTAVARLVNIKMTAAAILSTRALKSGFADRAKHRVGRFLTSAELALTPDRSLSNLLVKLGLKPLANGSEVYLTSGPKQCLATVYLDGLLYYTAQANLGEPPDFSRTFARDYAAIEFYASPDAIPAEYTATRAGCGVLFLWTKD